MVACVPGWVFRRPVNPLKTNLLSCTHLRTGIVSLEGTELLSDSVVGSGPKRGQQGSKSTSSVYEEEGGPVTLSALSTSSRLATVEPGLEPQIWWFLGQHFPHHTAKWWSRNILTKERFKKLNDAALNTLSVLSHSWPPVLSSKTPPRLPSSLIQAQKGFVESTIPGR